jgi:ferrochelatase
MPSSAETSASPEKPAGTPGGAGEARAGAAVATAAAAERSTLDVALLSFGGPRNLEEIPEFMVRLTGGEAPPELLSLVEEKYAAVGGASPLMEISERMAATLEATLRRRLGFVVRVRPGYLHTRPSISEVMAGLDAHDVMALSLSPYTSRLTTDTYKKTLADAGRADVPLIEGWSADLQYLQAISEHVARALDGRQSSEYAVMFTAHNVPEETILAGDPYVEEIQHTIAQLIPVIMPGDWRLGWQSKGRRGDARWLEPEVEDVALQFAAQGWQKLLVVPVGFLCDNVETMYDLDIVLRKVVEDAGMHYLRSEPANDSPRCIEALADAVITYLAMRPLPDQPRPAAG